MPWVGNSVTKPPKTAVNQHSQPKILVVDDDAALRLLVCAALDQSGMDVIEAADGREALESFDRYQPDAVLLDVMMPELDGFATCRAIREKPAGTHVPVLMMTGLEDVESIDRAYEIGATDFITKPVNYTLITYRVKYMLRGAAIANELRESEARLSKAQSLAKLGNWEWNLTTHRLVCSELVEDLFGVTNESRLDSNETVMQRIHPDDRQEIVDLMNRAFSKRCALHAEYRIVKNDDVIFINQETTFTQAADGGAEFYSGVVQDVSARKIAEQHAHELKNFDAVTGLPNRSLVTQELSWAIDLAQRHERTLAVLSLGLDDFKRINDSLGRDAGDEILKAVALKLVRCVRSTDTITAEELRNQTGQAMIARVGGDEFVVVLSEIKSPEDAAIVSRRIRTALTDPIVIDGEQIVVSASIGISAFPHDGNTPEELLKHAEAALNVAKQAGRNRDQFYTSSINARVSERFALETNMRKALAAEQFELWYQPKLELATHDVVGAEALIRWRDPDLGIISPQQFIPIAEDTGLIVPLGAWIVDEACRQISTWQDTGMERLHIAINLSAAQFATDDIHRQISGAVEAHGIPITALELELTESLIMTDIDDTVPLLEKLNDAGFSLWIDDFGTGYSSLSYLKTLPLTGLKIDQSFVREMHQNQDDASIIAAVITLANGLGLSVVAEGAELSEHVVALAACGCHFVQGYYFAAPMPIDRFESWVRDHDTRPALVASG